MPQVKPPLTSRGKALLLIADLLFVAISFSFVGYLRFHRWGWTWGIEPTTGAIGAFIVVYFYILGAYDVDEEGGRLLLWRRLALALLLTLGTVLGLTYLFQMDRSGFFGRGVLLGGLSLDFLIAGSVRAVWRARLQQQRHEQSWLVLTGEKETADFVEELRRNNLRGVVDVQALGAGGPRSGAEFARILEQPRSGVILAAPESEWGVFGSELVHARLHGLAVAPLSSVFERLWKKIPVEHLDHRWFLQSDGFGLVNSPARQRVKRLVDLGAASLLLLVTWPFMLLTALAVKLESHGPALYRQTRTGRGGEDFVIFKFRSMRSDAEKHGAQWATKNDSRITRVGNFIRKTRLDELPQLFNVLRGEMSFIGPRPERPEFNESLAKEIPFYQLRHLVRPGITGWAQVMYPYGASVEDAKRKLEYDLYYIKNYSLVFDVKIILKTIRIVLFARGR